jgi:PAS domain S-box-containing protein
VTTRARDLEPDGLAVGESLAAPPSPTAPPADRTVAQRLAELEAVYRDAPVGLAVIDGAMRYVRVNARLAAINGRPPAEHVGRTLREVAPVLADAAESCAARVFATGEPMRDVALSCAAPGDPGGVRHYVQQWHPLRGRAGAVTGVHVTVEDVTDRRRADAQRGRLLAALRASEARFRGLLESAHEGVWAFDADGRTTYVNARLAEMLGRPASAVVGRRMRDFALERDASAPATAPAGPPTRWTSCSATPPAASCGPPCPRAPCATRPAGSPARCLSSPT